MGSDRCTMTSIHHYSILQYFHCPKNPWCYPFILFPSLNSTGSFLRVKFDADGKDFKKQLYCHTDST